MPLQPGEAGQRVYVCIIKAPPGLFQVQSQMHAHQGQEVLLNQRKVAKASPRIIAQQGTNMQMGATKKGADITGVENGSWSSDVSLELLELPFDKTPSTMVILSTSMKATIDFVLAQPGNT